jgi:hypothetical protein
MRLALHVADVWVVRCHWPRRPAAPASGSGLHLGTGVPPGSCCSMTYLKGRRARPMAGDRAFADFCNPHYCDSLGVQLLECRQAFMPVHSRRLCLGPGCPRAYGKAHWRPPATGCTCRQLAVLRQCCATAPAHVTGANRQEAGQQCGRTDLRPLSSSFHSLINMRSRV